MDSKTDKTNVRVRLAAPGDASRVASLMRESFAEYKTSYTEEAYAATTPASDEVRNRIGEGTVWVALYDDKIVGTVSAVREGESLYIRSMAVPPAARGLGIGNLLLQEIENVAAARGFKRLFLNTTPFLARAIRLYEHFGFKRRDEGADDLFGTPLFTMEKTLEPSATGKGGSN